VAAAGFEPATKEKGKRNAVLVLRAKLGKNVKRGEYPVSEAGIVVTLA
jgi:hypothetical protein